MFGFLPKLKRIFVEPKVYAVTLESRHGAILHLGVHYSLEEAIGAATPTLMAVYPHEPEDTIAVDMWTCLDSRTVVNAVTSIDPRDYTDHTTKKNPVKTSVISNDERVKQIRDSKNQLMKSLIEGKNIRELEKVKDLLSKPEQNLIIDKIREKKNERAKSK